MMSRTTALLLVGAWAVLATASACGGGSGGTGSKDGGTGGGIGGEGAVMKVGLGGGSAVALASGQPGPTRIVQDGCNVYWLDPGAGSVMKLPK